MFYSQIGQDQILNTDFFQNRQNGFFVDIGAYDGIEFSNTLWLEQELNWNGICIEPHPKRFKNLQQNRKCICVNAAAFNRKDVLPFRLVEMDEWWERAQQFPAGQKAKSATAIQNEMLSGLMETMDPRHHVRIDNEHNCPSRAGMPGKSSVVNVECVMLKDLFEEHNVKIVDYMTIDVENAELQVLGGVDFDKVHINVIDFEIEHEERRQPIYDFLSARGFHFHKNIQWDSVWVNNTVKWSFDK